MAALKLFQASAASGLALLAFATATPEAEAQTGSLGRNDPPICRTYEAALRNQRDYVGEARARLGGTVITGLLGGYSNRGGANAAGRSAQDMMRAETQQRTQEQRISSLADQCFTAREIVSEGECRTYSSETATTPTYGGRVSGQAQGQIRENRTCTGASVGGAQSGYSGLTPRH